MAKYIWLSNRQNNCFITAHSPNSSPWHTHIVDEKKNKNNIENRSTAFPVISVRTTAVRTEGAAKNGTTVSNVQLICIANKSLFLALCLKFHSLTTIQEQK